MGRCAVGTFTGCHAGHIGCAPGRLSRRIAGSPVPWARHRLAVIRHPGRRCAVSAAAAVSAVAVPAGVRERCRASAQRGDARLYQHDFPRCVSHHMTPGRAGEHLHVAGFNVPLNRMPAWRRRASAQRFSLSMPFVCRRRPTTARPRLGPVAGIVLISYTTARMQWMQNDCPSRQGKLT